MKKSKLYLIIGSIVGLLILSYISIRKWIRSIEYGIASGVKINDFRFQNIFTFKLTLPMYFYNPTPFNLVLGNLDLDLYFDNIKMSKIILERSFKLKSKSRSNLPFEVTIKGQDIINYLAEKGEQVSDPDWLKKTRVRIEGTVDVDLGVLKIRKIPINFSDSLKYYVG